jgi:hypothetical protein
MADDDDGGYMPDASLIARAPELLAEVTRLRAVDAEVAELKRQVLALNVAARSVLFALCEGLDTRGQYATDACIATLRAAISEVAP